MSAATTTQVDCVILGGSYGGLSAALTLGRSLRNVVVIDEGLPCNRFADHSQNFLTHDGDEPAAIAQAGRQQIQDKYKTVQFYQGRAISAASTGESTFQVTTESGDLFETKGIIFATGVTDVFPDIPGFAECWGKSVVHCPYCHGFEYHSQPTGMFMNPMVAMHMTPLVRNLTPDVKVFCPEPKEGMPGLTEEQLALMASNGVEVIKTGLKEIQHENGKLTGVVLEDGKSIPLKALYAAIPFELNCRSLMEGLGCTISDDGYVVVDAMFKTSVKGVFACGDATTKFRTVANAVHGGNFAAAVTNMELSFAEFAGRKNA